MTVVISIKIFDGIVFASDSAVTMRNPQGIENIYENSDKIFNLIEDHPVGAVSWGIANIGMASISRLLKDFKKKILGEDSNWKIDPINYTIKDIVIKLRKHIYDDNYKVVFKDLEEEKKPFLALWVLGYSSGEDLAEEWQITIDKGKCKDLVQVIGKNKFGISWGGQTEVISRIYYGFSDKLPEILKANNLSDQKINEIINQCKQTLKQQLWHNAMPIQDAIDLAKFLVNASIQFSKFSSGSPTVGGPIEVAAITKHEGFKWFQRKPFYE